MNWPFQPHYTEFIVVCSVLNDIERRLLRCQTFWSGDYNTKKIFCYYGFCAMAYALVIFLLNLLFKPKTDIVATMILWIKICVILKIIIQNVFITKTVFCVFFSFKLTATEERNTQPSYFPLALTRALKVVYLMFDHLTIVMKKITNRYHIIIRTGYVLSLLSKMYSLGYLIYIFSLPS